MNAAIDVRGIRKSFGTLPVLRGVDLTVERGTIMALLGSNGAGKTTLVRILATLLGADGGTATVAGHDVARHPDRVRQAISLTGQFTAVDEMLTGRENLTMLARLRRPRASEGSRDAGGAGSSTGGGSRRPPSPAEEAARLLARFRLDEAAGRRAGTYSGGMRRRLDIAMSLLGGPEVVFLDEPTTGLDPEARREVWDAVRELAAGGTTVLLTTQYLDEAEQLADRVAILHEGRVIADDTLAGLRAMLPAATVEYVERQPTLEEIFLAITGKEAA